MDHKTAELKAATLAHSVLIVNVTAMSSHTVPLKWKLLTETQSRLHFKFYFPYFSSQKRHIIRNLNRHYFAVFGSNKRY